MSSEPVISVRNLSKRYRRFASPRDRLKQLLWRNDKTPADEFQALQDASFDIMRGEVVGIIGRNGAGKSTLLQLICGTLTPSSGDVLVKGRVAALLELGAGFNPDFTGRENIFMSAAIMGLPQQQIADLYDGIVEFSGVSAFIDQPLKTYSSGMYVRLAFAVATSVTPDILVIDEALSVGDGAFARKSFDRIMTLKEAGCTILFCSHSMYQIDALCERAIWLENGRIRMTGKAAAVTSAYNTALALESVTTSADSSSHQHQHPPAGMPVLAASAGSGRITRVIGCCGSQCANRLQIQSRTDTLEITVEFVLDPSLPPPTVALGIENAAGMAVSSLISSQSDVPVTMDATGKGQATVVFPNLPLMKGEYRIAVFLACEKGLHVYDWSPQCVTLDVNQEDALQGVVVLPHEWRNHD